MIFFILDACAIARIYFPDIGTANMLSIYNYPNSKMLAPNFAYSEAISAAVAVQQLFQSKVILIPVRVVGKLALYARLICVHQLIHSDFKL